MASNQSIFCERSQDTKMEQTLMALHRFLCNRPGFEAVLDDQLCAIPLGSEWIPISKNV